MDNLLIEATKSTPLIEFDVEKNFLKIHGQSYPENSAKFYNPILEWITEYVNQLDTTMVLDIKIIYINTSSSKALMTLLDMLEEAYKNGKQITINWHYDEENEMALECGEDFSEDLELPFNIIEDKSE